MSNRAYLFNTALLTSDRDEIESARVERGIEYAEADEAANRIPIPWLYCFREADLRPVQAEYYIGPEEVCYVPVRIPCTTVVMARENMQHSLPFFRQIVGDTAVADGYWKGAMDKLASLPLPYLTMHPTEVFCLNDAEEEAAAFAKCFCGTEASIPFVKRLSFYVDGFAPYTIEEFFSSSPERLDNQARTDNAAALIMGAPDYLYWRRRDEANVADTPASAPKPWWKLW
jgi:hypothetical protein